MIESLLFSTLWQGAIIVALAAIVVRFVPKRNAATQYAVWYIALLALATVPVATEYSHLGATLLNALHPAASGNVVFSILLTPLRDAGAAAADTSAQWIVVIWATGAFVQILRLIVSFARIARIQRGSQPYSPAYGDVRISHDIAIPIAAGFISPRVILPHSLTQTLTSEDLEPIIAHERAHIRRKDIAANLLQQLLQAALYFNPWAWIAGRQIANAREAACDDLAVHATGNEECYARCLTRLARIPEGHTPLATPSAIGRRHALVARIERLLGASSPHHIAPNYYTIGGTVIVFAALTLALQALSPAASAQPSAPTTPQVLGNTVAAASCPVRNAFATVLNPAEPRLPSHDKNVRGWAEVRVTVSPTGEVSKAVVAQSEGSPAVRQAALDAAERTRFTPKIVNCKPVAGTYLFKISMDGQGPNTLP